MTNEPFKPEMFLQLHARIPIEEKIEGEELYRQLKEMLKNYSEKINLWGQINETLEPCCTDKIQSKIENLKSSMKGVPNDSNSQMA